MEIKHVTKDNILIVTFAGDFVSSNIAAISKYVAPLLGNVEKDESKIGMIFDMKQVTILDSSGIGFICGRFVRLKKKKKKLALCDLNPNLEQMMSAANLTDLIPIGYNQFDALVYLREEAL